MATKYQYDPKTGKWKSVTVSDDTGSSPSTTPTTSDTGGGSTETTETTETPETTTTTPSPTTSSGGGGENLTSTTGDSLSSEGTTEKEYNEIEMNTLEGSLSVLPTEDTIKINPGDTISLEGLGKYLSGSYYVKEVTRSIGTGGYQQTLTVIKTDFGKTLKSASVVEQKDPSSSTENSRQDVQVPSPQTAEEQTPTRTYTVKDGDCLWNIAKQFYGDGSQFTKIYDANTGQIPSSYLIYTGQVLTIP